jgi:hypothetical protein
MSNAYNQADGNASGAGTKWSGGKQVVQSGVTRGSAYCTPGVGQPAGSVTGHAADSYSALGFVAADAQNVAAVRLNSLLPKGYYWSSGPSTCSDTGTAANDRRTTSSAGQQAIAGLKALLAGKSLANAKAICNSYPGVSSGTCSITLQGGQCVRHPRCFQRDPDSSEPMRALPLSC